VLDADGDGRITRKEYEAGSNKGSDGTVSRAEWNAARHTAGSGNSDTDVVSDKQRGSTLGTTQLVPAAATTNRAITGPASADTWIGTAAEEAEQQPCRASGARATDAPWAGVDVSPGGAVVTWMSDSPRNAEQQLEAAPERAPEAAPRLNVPLPEDRWTAFNRFLPAHADGTFGAAGAPARGTLPKQKTDTTNAYLKKQTKTYYVPPRGREQLNQKPAADPSVISPEPPVQETTTAELNINGCLVEHAKPGVTAWRQSMKLKAKTPMCLAAASLINHTRVEAKAVLLQEMWIIRF
jgi:hypothetical protein